MCGAVSSRRDTDGPKYTNDMPGYDIGDWASSVTVEWTCSVVGTDVIAVWSGVDEPATAIFGSLV